MTYTCIRSFISHSTNKKYKKNQVLEHRQYLDLTHSERQNFIVNIKQEESIGNCTGNEL